MTARYRWPLLHLSFFIFILLKVPDSQAATITMTPDPVGDWICLAGHCGSSSSTRTADVTLLSGDTGPAVTLEFRTRITGGGPFANSTVSFLFDLDADVTAASISGSSGSFSAGPTAFLSGTNGLITLNCTVAPCNADLLLTLAAVPTTGTIRDTVNQFIDSPGAPNQILPMTFGVVPIPTAVWLFGSALGLLGWIKRKSV